MKIIQLLYVFKQCCDLHLIFLYVLLVFFVYLPKYKIIFKTETFAGEVPVHVPYTKFLR